jgi:pectinesterase
MTRATAARILAGLVLAADCAPLAAHAQAPLEAPGAGCTVAADGTGQFKSVQEAINAAPQTRSALVPWTIRIRPGTYRELVYVQREKNFVRLVGEDPARTTITFNLYASLPAPDGKAIGTFHTPTVWIDADDFSLENLTIANSSVRMGQALALRVDGDRVSFRNCRFVGWQDTILVNRGRQYFGSCEISGAVDFIFGGATAYFDRCSIHCVGTGYITAASTPATQAFGLVFSGCRITGDAGAETYLGRPWRAYGGVIFLNTEMSRVIRPVGWHNWNQPEREKTSRFAEFGSSGPGADPSARVPWAKALSAAEAAQITVQRVLGGADGWNPGSPPGQ